MLKVIPDFGQQINSMTPDGKDNQKFTDVTNTSHSTMKANWATGGIMTACNGFVGWYGASLGADPNQTLGRFDIEKRLSHYGKANAWVKSEPGNRPKFGDICRWTKFHMDVSLDFDGNYWCHVDAGQGGSKTGYDILKRIHMDEIYSYKLLQGWVDIEIFFGEAAVATTPAQLTVPEWLVNWWKVTWKGIDFYYSFDANKQVKWTLRCPLTFGQSPLNDGATGTFSIGSDGVVTVSWPTGTVEKFTRGGSGPYEDQMAGTNNDYEPLTAVTLF